jgi:hypothetical protein
MSKRIIFLLILVCAMLFFAACGPARKISKQYEGNGRDMLFADFGEPQRVLELENGNEMFIYIKETAVRETEIGTGSFTLDPRVSPSFIKEEIFRFEIDKDGVVVDTQYEKRQR